MKKTLLLLFVCLFGALGGVKAEWTSQTPSAGNTYYLYNTTRGNYFQANTTGPYNLISDIAYATPVTMITGSESDKYYLEFKVGGTSYRLCHSAGTPQLTDWGHNYAISGNVNDGYDIKSHVKDKSGDWSAKDRWFSAWDSYHCNFPQNTNENAYRWKFVSVEDALAESGWKKVTSVEALKNQPENYLYAILSANNSSLIVRTDASTGHGYYRSMCAPLSSSEYLFSIENYIYDSKDYFVMKAENTNAYYHAENNAAYDLVAKNKSTVDSDCRLEFEYADNAWNIKTWTSYSGDPTCGSYWGLWDYNQGYADGKKMAGNKNENEKGSFLIYRIPKYNLDMTGRIYNHSFELDNVSDSKRVGAKGWTLPQTDGDTKVQLNSNETYTMTTVDGSQLFNTWNGDATGYTISQTISNLPAGQYKVSAVMASFENKTLQLKANDATGTAPSVNKGTGVEVNTYVTLENPGDIAISAKTADGAFYKVDNFRLTYYGTPATSTDYTALQDAINDAEANLGFDAGEYAPYNNVAVLNALAAAKSIDQNANNQRALTQSAIRAIADENWTVNSGEKNAIYWPVYTDESAKDAENRIYAIGWGKAGGSDAYNTRVIIGTTESNVGVYNNLSNHEALMTKFNTNYGVEVGYTMPLKANTLYKLSFKYGGMENTPEVTVSFTDPSSDVITLAPNFVPTEANAHTSAEDKFDVYEGYFVTNEAGNYVLNLSKNPTSQQQIAMGNIELTKVASQTLTFADNAAMPTYAPGTYPRVRVSRTLNTGENVWNTLVLPFGYTNADWAVRELTSSTEDNLSLSVVDGGAMTAGKPYLVRPNETETSIEAENVDVITTPTVVVTEKYSFIPVFAPTTITGDGTNYFVATGTNKLYCAKANINTNGYRAYFHYTGTNSGARSVVLNFDEVGPTAINAIEAAEAEDGALKDGKYIIDNKVVIVKNGVKYSANGQKLN